MEAEGSAARCSSCGAPHEPRQEYCLECGARLRSYNRSRHWVWPSLLALGVAIAGCALAVVASGNVGESSPQTIVATQLLVPVPPQPKAPAKTATKPTKTTPPPTRTGVLVTWPGGDQYTVVLSSFPTRTGLLAAKTKAEEAARAGLSDVGVLVSSSYSSLHPGYFVVFSGIYRTLEEAQSDLPQITPRFPSAHAEQIAR
jgi:hypothetical protein